ncbi:MAG TPA: hypothetical protein VIX86_04550 [Streptosporangiaceae bacterium]
MAACGHCDGTGVCPLPRCARCLPPGAAAAPPGWCAACDGTGGRPLPWPVFLNLLAWPTLAGGVFLWALDWFLRDVWPR